MHYSRLQYISSGKTTEEQQQHIVSALNQGVSWIQIRMKNADEDSLRRLIHKVVALKQTYAFTLIVNDYAHLALEVGVDGLHLGLTDMPLAEARALLGPQKIIGGTANSTSDVQQRIKEGCDYIGLGPLRHTNSKEKLSPILGLDGYRKIMAQVDASSLPPLFAIGGIKDSDIKALRQLGLYGVALSKHIQDHFDNKQHVKQLNTLLYEHEIDHRG